MAKLALATSVAIFALSTAAFGCGMRTTDTVSTDAPAASVASAPAAPAPDVVIGQDGQLDSVALVDGELPANHLITQ